MKLTPRGAGLAQLMCEQFVMLSGKSAEAYHVKSGDRMGREAHLQYCLGHYGDLEFEATDANGNRVTEMVSAGKAFWDMKLPHKRFVRRVVLEPGAPFDPTVYNRWDWLKQEMCPPDMTAQPNDIGIFIAHLMYISDNDAEAVTYFLNWLATLYQRPEVKIPTAIMMYSRKGRLGKSMIHKVLSRVFGASMVGNCAGHEMQKNFMDAIEDKRLVVLNELARTEKADAYERFKNMVSEPDLQFEGKGRASKAIKNVVHYILTTNHDDCLPLMEEDGRILVMRCEANRRPDAYYKELSDWMEGPGPALLAGVLAQWQFPAGWDPYAPVPQTEACVRTQQESRPGLQGFLAELMARHAAPFDRDLGMVAELVEALHREYPGNCKGFKVSNHHMSKALQALGAEQVRVAWTRANKVRTTSVPYVWRNLEKWATASRQTGSLTASQELVDFFEQNYK